LKIIARTIQDISEYTTKQCIIPTYCNKRKISRKIYKEKEKEEGKQKEKKESKK